MTVGDADLFNMYKTNSDLVLANAFTLTELDNMIPFERALYIDMYNAHVEEKNKARK